MTKHAYTVKEASETTGLSRSLLYVEIKRGSAWYPKTWRSNDHP